MKTMILFMAALALTACASIGGPDDDWRRQPGLISVGGAQQPPVELADTLHGTGTVSVVVRTWGSSSCTIADGADVEYDDPVVVIRPWDRVKVRGICTDDLAPHPRDVELTFDRPGVWTVQVVGRSFDDGHVFEKDVVVEQE